MPPQWMNVHSTVDCLIPFLRDAINNAIDDEDGIEQADEFAKRLAQIERGVALNRIWSSIRRFLSVVDHPSLPGRHTVDGRD